MRDAIALLELRQHPNVQAWLRLIRLGESSQEENAYRYLFGSTRRALKLFDAYDDHPRVRTYEAYDGQFIKNGKIDYTTAAGAYQITETTWNGVSKRLGLKDFSPKSQDIAALARTEGRGALEDVLAGRIEEAIRKCVLEWASLPNSPYGQPTKTLAQALAAYTQAGGQFAPQEAPTVGAPTTPQPLAEIAPAGPEPATAWPFPAPVTTAEPKEPSMAPLALPFAVGLAKSLFEVFTPLAREKLTKEIDRHTDSPEIAAQIANGVIETAKQMTGKPDPVEAVATAKAEPAIVQAIETDALATLERLAPILDKMHQWEQASWAAEEGSRDAAAARAKGEDYDTTKILIFGMFSMVGVLLAILATVIGVQLYKVGKVETEVWAQFAGIIGVVLGITGTIYAYRFGSSRSSGAKDVVIGELSRRPGAR